MLWANIIKSVEKPVIEMMTIKRSLFFLYLNPPKIFIYFFIWQYQLPAIKVNSMINNMIFSNYEVNDMILMMFEVAVVESLEKIITV